jgi:hypothetical protein
MDKVIDRIRKLLALAKSANEHEAAAAAARAAELMAEHELSEATIRATGGAAAEQIVEAPVDGTSVESRKCAWKLAIAHGAAAAFGVRMWIHGGKIVGMGRSSAVQTWSYTCAYLYAEVERLTIDGWLTVAASGEAWAHSSRAWKSAFRLGAGRVIGLRLLEQAHRKKSAPVATGEALVIISRDRAEVEAAFAERTAGFRKGRAVGKASDAAGYRAGTTAGRDLSLGGSRAGLPAPQRKLGGGS